MENQKILYGCLPAKYDVRDYKLCSANANVEYPKEFILENLPKVKNLQMVNSCCAHATSTILEYHTKNMYDLSTNFIYGILKSLCGLNQPGMYLKDALSIVTSYGDMVEKDCPGNNEVPSCYKIAEDAFNDLNKLASAHRFRINSYYLCLSDNDIKYALMNFGPVLGAINWRDTYQLDKDNVIYFDRKSNGGGHAITIIGWNTRGWIIQNSWSEQFGDKGRFILPFSYGFMEARAVIDEENDEELFKTGVLNKPVNNLLLNIIYKIYNKVINLFR